MIEYPHIQNSKQLNLIGEYCFIYQKYDGSNIRIEFSRNKGFYKFGTRTTLIDKNTPLYGEVIPLFETKYRDYLLESMKQKLNRTKITNAVLFMEWFGVNSFAGFHINEDHKLILFDMFVNKEKLINPSEFNQFFKHIPFKQDQIWEGYLTEQIIEDIRSNENIGEGVVIKTNDGKMAKIKTFSYLTKLKKLHGENWNKYWE